MDNITEKNNIGENEDGKNPNKTEKPKSKPVDEGARSLSSRIKQNESDTHTIISGIANPGDKHPIDDQEDNNDEENDGNAQETTSPEADHKKKRLPGIVKTLKVLKSTLLAGAVLTGGAIAADQSEAASPSPTPQIEQNMKAFGTPNFHKMSPQSLEIPGDLDHAVDGTKIQSEPLDVASGYQQVKNEIMDPIVEQGRAGLNAGLDKLTRQFGPGAHQYLNLLGNTIIGGVFDRTNIDSQIREEFINAARKAGVPELELHRLENNPTDMDLNHTFHVAGGDLTIGANNVLSPTDIGVSLRFEKPL